MIMGFFGSIIVGIVAGYLGGLIFKGRGMGLIGNLVVGILGGMLGYWALGKLGIDLGEGWIGAILTGAIGAIIILAIYYLLFKKK